MQVLQQAWLTNNALHFQRHHGVSVFTMLTAPKYLTRQDTAAIQHLELDHRVTEADVFDEVDGQNAFYDPVEGEFEKDWKKFMRGWLSWHQKANPLLEQYKPFVAFGINSRSDVGISRCKIELPPFLKEPGIIVKKSSNGEPQLIHVFTPGGTITAPHIDNTGKGHILAVSLGQKLVIWWDPLPNTLKQYGYIHGKRKGDLTPNAVERWQGLHWVVLHEQEFIVLPPGTIHAVLSAVNSAASGWEYLDTKWLHDGLLDKMTEWELGLAANMKRDPLQKHLLQGDASILRVIADDLEFWEDCLIELESDSGSYEKLRQLLEKCQTKLNGLLEEDE